MVAVLAVLNFYAFWIPPATDAALFLIFHLQILIFGCAKKQIMPRGKQKNPFTFLKLQTAFVYIGYIFTVLEIKTEILKVLIYYLK